MAGTELPPGGPPPWLCLGPTAMRKICTQPGCSPGQRCYAEGVGGLHSIQACTGWDVGPRLMQGHCAKAALLLCQGLNLSASCLPAGTLGGDKWRRHHHDRSWAAPDVGSAVVQVHRAPQVGLSVPLCCIWPRRCRPVCRSPQLCLLQCVTPDCTGLAAHAPCMAMHVTKQGYMSVSTTGTPAPRAPSRHPQQCVTLVPDCCCVLPCQVGVVWRPGLHGLRPASRHRRSCRVGRHRQGPAKEGERAQQKV